MLCFLWSTDPGHLVPAKFLNDPIACGAGLPWQHWMDSPLIHRRRELLWATFCCEVRGYEMVGIGLLFCLLGKHIMPPCWSLSPEITIHLTFLRAPFRFPHWCLLHYFQDFSLYSAEKIREKRNLCYLVQIRTLSDPFFFFFFFFNTSSCTSQICSKSYKGFKFHSEEKTQSLNWLKNPWHNFLCLPWCYGSPPTLTGLQPPGLPAVHQNIPEATGASYFFILTNSFVCNILPPDSHNAQPPAPLNLCSKVSLSGRPSSSTYIK